jgi:hypothetical protein
MNTPHPQLPEFALVVLTHGFVYAGCPAFDGDYIRVTHAKNVRVSGTTRGFGQLAKEGPNNTTQLDPCPDLLAPLSAVVHIITSKEL